MIFTACTIATIYAPTKTNTPGSIDGFYNLLNQTLRNIHISEKIILMGDFNGRVGDDFSTWKNVIGMYLALCQNLNKKCVNFFAACSAILLVF